MLDRYKDVLLKFRYYGVDGAPPAPHAADPSLISARARGKRLLFGKRRSLILVNSLKTFALMVF